MFSIIHLMSNWFKVYGFSDIQDKLLVGAYPLDEHDVAMLQFMKIERVLNLVEDEEYEPGQREEVEDALLEAGIEERRLSLTDYGRLPPAELELAVGEVNAWLEEGRRVYLHCRAGWQRSAAVAAGVVALREGVEIETALEIVHQRKPSAEPLPQQREDLLRWWAERDTDGQNADETDDAALPDEASVEEAPGLDEASADEAPEPDDTSAEGVSPTDDAIDETPGSDESSADDELFEADDIEDLLNWLAELDPARRGEGADDADH